MKAKKVHFFNRMKQHWKKFLKEEKETEEKMKEFIKNPENFTDERKGEVEEVVKAEVQPQAKPKQDEVWTTEKILKKIKEMLKERGTKSYITGQVHQHVKTYRLLLSVCKELPIQVNIKFHIVNSLFDTNSGTSHLLIFTWKRIYNELVQILDILFDNPQLRLVEGRDEGMEENSNLVFGHLYFSLEKLHDEFIRSLQNIDPQTPEYLIRLSHEKDMYNLLQYAVKYYQKSGGPEMMKNVSFLATKLLEYLYYKHEAIGGGVEDVKFVHNEEEQEEEQEVVPPEDSNEEPPEEQPEIKDEEKDTDLIAPKMQISPITNLAETVSHLAGIVYGHLPDDSKKGRVMLQHIYHLALHDKYTEARDRLLMAHLPEKIHKAKITDQIMFNRTLVQLGLAAFRAGKIEDANNCLQDIIILGKDKAKELLAQGITRYQGEKNSEQEKQERSRQIPYHMHINLDLIEFIILVCGMLLEIPSIAQSKFREPKRKVLSNFRKSYDFYNDRQLFTGPPENTKEAVIVAAKCLEKGDWKICREIISKLEIWKGIQNGGTVLERVVRLIQEQGLRTFLLSYSQYYDTIHISHLATMFELEENVTHALISNMMMSGELQASLDQSSGAIVVESQHMSLLQHLAINFAEKANVLLENNEQLEQRVMYDRRWNEGQGQVPGAPAVVGSGRGQKVPYQKGQGRGGYQYNPKNNERFLKKKGVTQGLGRGKTKQ